MTKFYLTGIAILAIGAPAAARDHAAYFGIEAGPMWVKDSHVDLSGIPSFDIDHKLGVDGDLIAGYDFGLVRLEAEGAYKWAKHDRYDFDGGSTEGDGHSRVYSLMGNAMVDVGKNDSFNVYLGAGAGIAWVREFYDDGLTTADMKDSNLAWQLIGGVRAPVFRSFDVGLKYRYFNGGHVDTDFVGANTRGELRSKFTSHSLLASLIYNWGPEPVALAPPPPPPPPPPPAPPPATQTCPDGTVILATDACPAPPPPPPPPEPTPERG